MSLSFTDIIDKLGLEPLPDEGGYFRRSYESAHSIDLGKGYNQPLGTGIYFLLTKTAFSALHRLKEDEMYHFYLGDPVELFELSIDTGLRKTMLGQDLLNGHTVQRIVHKNNWQGSRLASGGDWALLGTTMTPGFVWHDFELGKRTQLLSEYPEYKNIIMDLTREHD